MNGCKVQIEGKFTLDSKMAEEKLNFVMEDLQKHLLSANVEVANLSNIAKNGDEKVNSVLAPDVMHLLVGLLVLRR